MVEGPKGPDPVTGSPVPLWGVPLPGEGAGSTVRPSPWGGRR